jgi:ribosome biogenesis GTPase A
MSLQWYPGHMTKARRELAARLPSQDLVIEVLDARLPASSTNPLLTELRRQKPCIKVLTRSDMADPVVTRAWIAHLEVEGQVAAMASTTERPQEARKRIAELIAGFGLRGTPNKPVRALIAGVPNVGKSTLINTLMGTNVAAVSDRPAVTKRQQRVVLKNGTVVTDTPGLMWPKIEDEAGALRGARAGSIPDTAIDYLTVGMFGAALLLARYPALIVARFKLAELPATAEAVLTEIGRRRGALRTGGVVDLHKASEILVHEVRSGTIGPISLEAPG